MEHHTIIHKQRFPSPHPNVTMYIVTYLSQGLKVKGLLAEPKQEDVRDGFLYLRGGIKGVGAVRPARIGQFAQEGFIVFAPFYRGNQGGEGDEDFAGEDRWDAIFAFDLLKNHPKVRQVHVFGFSRGGIMALHTVVERPEAASLVTWGGVSDIAMTYEERVDMRRMMKRVIGGSVYKKEANYCARNVWEKIERIQSPTLIIHGEKDTNVSVHQAIKLESSLKNHHKFVETWYYSDYTHYFPPRENRRIVKRLCDWMKHQTTITIDR